MGQGPLGCPTNWPVMDPGTLAATASPVPGPQNSAPLNRTVLEELNRRAARVSDGVTAAVGEMCDMLTGLPEKEIENAESDIDCAETAQSEMRARIKRLQEGLDRDTRLAEQSYRETDAWWDVLLTGKERLESALAIGKTKLASEIAQLLVLFDAAGRRKVEALEKEIPKIRAELEKAKKDVKGAHAQMIINAATFVAFKALEVAFPPIGALEIFFRSAAMVFAVMSTDRMLGPSSDAWADLDAGAGGVVESLPHSVCKALTHHRKEVAGKIAALGTLVFDTKELLEAKHIVMEVMEKLERVEEQLDWFLGWIKVGLPHVQRLRVAVKQFEAMLPRLLESAKAADETYWLYKRRMGCLPAQQ